MATSGKNILVSGSWAYDYLMEYNGLLKDAILPEKLDHLSVGFTVSKKSVHFGGCAGNIAYNLRLLGADPVVVGLIGSDFGDYAAWMKKNGVDISTLTPVPNEFTASAYILTDREQNQIQIFHGGAMLAAPLAVGMREYRYHPLQWVIISPDDPQRMARLAQECKELGLKYMFDPSQQISNMSDAVLHGAIQGATALIVNEYEADLLTKKLGVTREALTAMVSIFIETHGERGSSVVSKDEGMFFIKAVTPGAVVDPTGCGDAFRAGILFGLSSGLGIERSCQIGALAATYTIENKGTQNHRFTLEEFKKRFEENFGVNF